LPPQFLNLILYGNLIEDFLFWEFINVS
jgi:hypothetical protein